MRLRNLFNPSYWKFNFQKYHELFDYDLKFNASFRGKEVLSKDDLNLLQIKYIRYYRLAQVSRNTIYHCFFKRRLYSLGIQTGIQLHENMNLPKGLIIGHPGVIIINENAKFEGDIMLTHGVTIGRDVRGKRAGSPVFQKNVCIRCNSTVVGGITIGEDVLIAPNTFVNFDVPSHSIVIGNPATIHHRENATEGHIGKVE